jgi:hypothetical protein
MTPDLDKFSSAPAGAAVQSSRRRFLVNSFVSVASLTSAAAIASPSIARTPRDLCSFPDLLERFDELYSRYRALRIADDTENEAYFRSRREKLGDNPSDADDNKFLLEYREAHPSDDPDLKRWEILNEQTFSLCREILARRPLNAADIILQARAVALMNAENWFENTSRLYNLDRDGRVLIERIMEFAGIDVFPGLRTISLEDMDAAADAREAEHEEEEAKRRRAEASTPPDPVWAAIGRHQAAIKHLNETSARHTAAEDALYVEGRRASKKEKAAGTRDGCFAGRF